MNKIERLSHYGILVIALSALFVSVWQVRISQRHNRMTVMPYMDFFIKETPIEGGHLAELTISNEGFGPAIVKSVVYRYADRDYEKWADAFEAACASERLSWRYNYNAGTVISPGSKLKLVGVKKFGPDRDKVEAIIKYESIYKDKSVMTIEVGF